jgi:hypothetical protein
MRLSTNQQPIYEHKKLLHSWRCFSPPRFMSANLPRQPQGRPAGGDRQVGGDH